MTDQRSASTSTSGDDRVLVGVVRGAHGLHGEVRVEQLTDVADRFRKDAIVECDDIGPLRVESVRPGTKSTIVKFAGIRDRAGADSLRGRHLYVSREEARRAAQGAVLWADLLGLRAFDPQGGEIGTLSEVLRAGETDVLVIRREQGELLVPALESVVREIDIAGGRIVVQPQEEA